jgi:regulator of protease activity HflC (stomatin/prohibitin superfamily)
MSFGVQLLIVLVFVGILVAALAAASVVIIQEYERGVVLTLGRFSGIRRPGLRFILPVIQQMQRVDTREKVVDIQPQDIITKDNVLLKVNGVVYYRVHDPRLAILDTADYDASTREMAQSTLRASVGTHELSN